MLVYILYTIFFVSCIVLVAAVLLQPGKTDAGALFTSNISSSAFGPRGTATILSKITIVAAAVFMLSALLISLPAVTGSRSVLQSNPDAPASQPTPDAGNTFTAPVGNAVVAPNGGNTAAPVTETAPGTAPGNTSAANASPANSAANSAAPASNK